MEHEAKRAFHPLDPRSARFRFALALAAAIIAYVVASAFVGSWSLRGVAGWDAFATVARDPQLALAETEPGDDLHASAAYRRQVGAAIAERALNRAIEQGKKAA